MTRRRAARPIGGLLAALLLIPAVGPAHADTHVVSLDEVAGVRMFGPYTSGHLGRLYTELDFENGAVGLGDVNGDGYDDIAALGRRRLSKKERAKWPSRTNTDRVWVSVVYVALGRRSVGTVGLKASDPGVFRIEQPLDPTGEVQGLDAAGDVNGDGYDDILVGTRASTYVVFGRRKPTTVNLAELRGRGFRLGDSQDECGWRLAGVGDVNGDGYDDIAVGGRTSADPTGFVSTLTSVILGSPRPDPSAGCAERPGFTIAGAWSFDFFDVDAAGDVNGDGLDDIVLAGFTRTVPGGVPVESAVVYGRRAPADVDLTRQDRLGDAGLLITGGTPVQKVAGVGDVNGDRFDDVLIAGPQSSGTAWVVFGGGAGPVDLAALGGRGFRVLSGTRAAQPAGIGDIDGDGADELSFGRHLAAPNGVKRAGSVYLVDWAGQDTVDLTGTADAALRIDGTEPFDDAGAAVDAAGDFNGDGQPDFLLSAHGVTASLRNQGAVYVFTGPPARLQVLARARARAVPRTGTTRLVRRISAEPSAVARVAVRVTPKSARRTVSVKATRRTVTVRTRYTPAAKVRVRVTAKGTGLTPVRFTRTWRVR